jgi:hypothetical protein
MKDLPLAEERATSDPIAAFCFLGFFDCSFDAFPCHGLDGTYCIVPPGLAGLPPLACGRKHGRKSVQPCSLKPDAVGGSQPRTIRTCFLHGRTERTGSVVPSLSDIGLCSLALSA